MVVRSTTSSSAGESDRMEMTPPHVLVFPCPLQGHLTPMLSFADLLAHSGILVTFLNSHHNHRLLLRHARRDAHHGASLLRFQSIPDGLADDNPRKADCLAELMESLTDVAPPLARDLLASGSPPFTCVIADGILSFMFDVAEEAGLPIIAFRTSSASSFWAYFCIPELIAAGDVPFPDEVDMDKETNAVLGMEGFLRLRDLPSFFRPTDVNNRNLQMVETATHKTTRARGLIFNTVDSLECLALTQIRRHIPKLYAIGPLHAQSPNSSTTTYPKDIACLTWLDRQPRESVVFVGFGSLALPSENDLLEIWHGLVNSGHRFLWAIRPDLAQVGTEGWDASSTMEKRWLAVGWVPQQEVLQHPAVGGFLTHSGWNSTLEGLHAGVPMLCRPFIADQHMNSRLVEKVWGVGFDMKDRCERGLVERMVRELMGRGGEMRRSVEKTRDVVRGSVDGEGGSSWRSLQGLIQDIRAMSSEGCAKSLSKPTP